MCDSVNAFKGTAENLLVYIQTQLYESRMGEQSDRALNTQNKQTHQEKERKHIYIYINIIYMRARMK